MNTVAVVCLLLGCMVLGQARYIQSRYPAEQNYCYDYLGRPVLSGQNYYDGCNTCTCGSFGRPTVCTRRYCGDDIIQPVKPVYPIRPVKPIYPVNSVKPVYPVNPVKPVYPVNPVKPVYPVNPVKPVYPVNPVKPVYPVNPVKPVYPVNPVKPVYPVNPVRPVRTVFPATY